MKYKVEIPLKLPSLNEYIRECRSNKYAGAKMKKDVENNIAIFINKLPNFKSAIKINFTWVESSKKRDLDNICFAKKFILDALVKCGKMKDDNRNYVTSFTDTFKYDKENKVVLEIEEVEE